VLAGDGTLRLLGLRSRGPTAVSTSLIRRFDLCFCLGSGVASGDCASREPGVITESNAEVLAGDILNIGNDEGNRQNVIVSSLLDARAAVDKISALTKEKK
jgi:hypothetical protein